MEEEMKCDRCGSDYSENYYKSEYDDEIICEECLLNDDKISITSIDHYYIDGEYMGNDGESIQEVIDNVCNYLYYNKIEEDSNNGD